MSLFVAGVVCVLLTLSFPSIDSELKDDITSCGDFFLERKSPVFPGILEDSVTKNNIYKIICQKYKNKIRFATLYDTEKRIPVFSAYKYTGTKEFVRAEIPKTRMTELQLEQSSDDVMRVPFINQARNQDYWIKDTSKKECTHGTLIPIKHTADPETAESIFTLTNTVPQAVGIRERIQTLEDKFKEHMDNNCRDNNNQIVAYVLTGAIPGKEDNKWNNRVNIPSFLWTAFCCYNSETTSWVSKTYRVENKISNNNVSLKDLDDLENFLNKNFKKGTSLFSNKCTFI